MIRFTSSKINEYIQLMVFHKNTTNFFLRFSLGVFNCFQEPLKTPRQIDENT